MDPELYKAAESGNWEVISRFSSKFSSQRTAKRNTVLHVLAQSCDSADLVQRVLARNCCLLTAKNARHETALHLAARNGHSGVVRELIAYSKQNKSGCWFFPADRCKRMLRMANADGNTALHEAVKNNFFEVAKLLIEEDAEFRYRPNHAMETPLYLAVEKGLVNIAGLILETCNVKSPSYLGPGHRTALHAAAIWNSPELMVKILEKLPEIIKYVDKFGWTALHYAAKFNHQDVVRLLLSARRPIAYVAAHNDTNKTALHVAVIHGHVGVVQEILSHFPDCWETCTNKSWNILHLAVKYEEKQVLEFLLQQPWASELINQKDRIGMTPLHFYVDTESLDGNSLVNHPRLDVNSFDDCNFTALDGLLEAADELSDRQRLIRDELQRAGGTPGRRNVSTIKKNLQSSSKTKNHESETLEKLGGTYMIVATLIATVAFAAGFTVAGGYNSSDGPNPGMAVLGKKATFVMFVISDSLALGFAVKAMVRQLKILQIKNPRYMVSGIRKIQSLIFGAILTMMIAFVTGLFSVLQFLSLKIVLCGIVVFFCCQIPWIFLSLRRKIKSRTYVSRFRNTEADYFSHICGFPILWYQDLSGAD